MTGGERNEKQEEQEAAEGDQAAAEPQECPGRLHAALRRQVTVAHVVYCPPGMKPGQRVKVLFIGTERQCSEWIGRRAWSDPEGVNRGDYGIDLEEEAKGKVARLRPHARLRGRDLRSRRGGRD